MLWGAAEGRLELRAEGGETRLSATFPYGRAALLADGPRPRREVIAARAFAARVEAGEDIHLLAGHDYNRPLASRAAGTLTLADGDDALTLEARIDGGTSWARDFLAAHAAGLIRGLSPGFRVRPGGETVEERDGGLLRTVRAADLYELSAVTRPAYPEAQIEARRWDLPGRSDNRSAPDGPNAADVAFAREMIPHHEMAVAMARTVLDKGSDPDLARMARAIVKAQTAEIATLRDWLGERGKARGGAMVRALAPTLARWRL